MAPRIDRRVQKTRQLLREALVALIREKGFAALSVQEIIDRANVGRATFYAHFDSKEDLLLTGLETVFSSLKEIQRQALAQHVIADIDPKIAALADKGDVAPAAGGVDEQALGRGYA